MPGFNSTNKKFPQATASVVTVFFSTFTMNYLKKITGKMGSDRSAPLSVLGVFFNSILSIECITVECDRKADNSQLSI